MTEKVVNTIFPKIEMRIETIDMFQTVTWTCKIYNPEEESEYSSRTGSVEDFYEEIKKMRDEPPES